MFVSLRSIATFARPRIFDVLGELKGDEDDR
jgi:hypothetical protein